MSERNPLTDPQPGDEVRHGIRDRRVVKRIGGDVYYLNRMKDGSYRERICWISTWQYWCIGGEVRAFGREGA